MKIDNNVLGLIGVVVVAYILWKNSTKSETSEGLMSGCTSPNAFNYNPQAVINDGSCAYGDTLGGPPQGRCADYRSGGIAGLRCPNHCEIAPYEGSIPEHLMMDSSSRCRDKS